MIRASRWQSFMRRLVDAIAPEVVRLQMHPRAAAGFAQAQRDREIEQRWRQNVRKNVARRAATQPVDRTRFLARQAD
jgi:hypothetical protein